MTQQSPLAVTVKKCPQPTCRLVPSSELDELFCIDHWGTILIGVPMDIPLKERQPGFKCIDCLAPVSAKEVRRCIACNGIAHSKAIKDDPRLRNPGKGIKLDHGSAFDAPISRVN